MTNIDKLTLIVVFFIRTTINDKIKLKKKMIFYHVI